MKKYIVLSIIKNVALLAGAVYAAVMRLWLPALLILAAILIDVYESRGIYGVYQAFRQMSQDAQAEQADEEKNSRTQLLLKQMQLNVLQNQINPHFLYNTLECIRSEALLSGQREIARMAEHLSRYFRYCISNRESIVSLQEEIKNIQDYYAIQRFRFGERISMEIQVLQEECYDCYLPRLTLQPLVENAIIHGIEGSDRNGLIQIIVDGSEESLFITIRDNGSGMPLEQLEKLNRELAEGNATETPGGKHSGIAVGNVNTRIRICFGAQYGLHYRSIHHQSTEVEIHIPRVSVLHREELLNNLRDQG